MKINRTRMMMLWNLVSFRGVGPLPLWLMVTLSGYCFAMFMALHITSVRPSTAEPASKHSWPILLICALLVEVLNQVTYRLAKKKPRSATIVKCATFWCIFTGGIAVHIYRAHGLPPGQELAWNQTAALVLIYVLLSWVFPIYSVSTNIRFFLLYGRFQKSVVDVLRDD
jgi:hypothetical protein